MGLHLEPIHWILRSYDEDNFELYSPFSGVMNIIRTAPDEAYAIAALGKFDKKMRSFLQKELNKVGITKLHFMRKNKEHTLKKEL